MGVSTTTNTVIDSGDGSTLAFSFPFYFFVKADLFVYIFDTVAKTIALKILGTDYTISGTPNAQGLYDNGGTVNFIAAPASTEKAVISRFPIETQTYALLQNGSISSTALVQQFDKLTLLIQSLQDQINRCVQFPAGFAPIFDPTLPPDTIAGDAIVVNTGNSGFEFGASGSGGSSGGLTVNPASADVTLVAADPVDQQYIPCDATAAAFNVTLPSAITLVIGQVFQIKQIDASGNPVTILPNGSDEILSTSIVSSLVLDFQGKSYSLVCRDVGVWDVI